MKKWSAFVFKEMFEAVLLIRVRFGSLLNSQMLSI